MALPEFMSSDWAAPYWRNEQVFSVQWELTHRCNFRCPNCYLSLEGRAGAYAATDVSFDDALRVLDELVELGVFFVTFTGGEVFLYPRFLELCAAARKRGLGVRILTNGSRIGHEEARTLAGLGVLSVEVTLYAGSRAGYQRMTGDPSGFRAVVRGLRLLQRYEVPVVLKTFYARANADEVEAIEHVARCYGLELQRSCALLPHIEDGLVAWEQAMTHPQAGRIAEALGEPAWIEAFDEILDRSLCGSCGRSRVFIAANGDVFPCSSTRWVVLGNAYRSSLVEAWRSDELQAKLASLHVKGNKPWQRQRTATG